MKIYAVLNNDKNVNNANGRWLVLKLVKCTSRL